MISMYSQYAIMTIQYANMAEPTGIVTPGKFLKKKNSYRHNLLNPTMAFVNNQTCVYNLDILCNVPQGPRQVGSGSLIFPLHLFPSELGFSCNFKVFSKSYLLFMCMMACCTCILHVGAYCIGMLHMHITCWGILYRHVGICILHVGAYCIGMLAYA